MLFSKTNEILVCRQAFYAPVTNPWDIVNRRVRLCKYLKLEGPRIVCRCVLIYRSVLAIVIVVRLLKKSLL